MSEHMYTLPSPNAHANSVISIRTSDARVQSVSSSGIHQGYYAPQTNVYHHDANNNASWNHITLPVANVTGKTTSFTSIHQEVAQDLSNQQLTAEITSGPRHSRGENPGGNAVGDNTVPMGDMLLPLLVMTLAYIIVKLFRNRKTSQAL